MKGTAWLIACAALAAGEYVASFAPWMAEAWPVAAGFAVFVAAAGYGFSWRGWRLLFLFALGASLFLFSSLESERRFRLQPWMRKASVQRRETALSAAKAKRASAAAPIRRELSRRVAIGLGREPEIAAVSRLFTVKRRVPAEWEAAKAREALAKVAAGQRLPRVTLLKSRQIAAYNPYDADTTDFEMIAMRIGPWAIVTAPGELYTEIGLRIKAASPFENTLICEQANDRAGYIVPDNVLGTTAYGGAYPSGRLGYGTADVMVNGAQDMLKTFKA